MERKVKEIADLLSIIEKFIKSGNLDSNSYEHFDQTTRRQLNSSILGMSERSVPGAGPTSILLML